MEWIFFLVLGGILLAGLTSFARAGRNDNTPIRDASADIEEDHGAFSHDSSSLTDDIYSDPTYSHLPGNIYYHTTHDDSMTLNESDDLCTNPVYDHLACNIYHRDDDWEFDDWSTGIGTGSHWDD